MNEPDVPMATAKHDLLALSHAYEACGFSSPAAMSLYLHELFRRHPHCKTVRIPKPPPPGMRRVLGVRCASSGRGCDRCEGWGYGARFVVAILSKPCTRHEA